MAAWWNKPLLTWILTWTLRKGSAKNQWHHIRQDQHKGLKMYIAHSLITKRYNFCLHYYYCNSLGTLVENWDARIEGVLWPSLFFILQTPKPVGITGFSSSRSKLCPGRNWPQLLFILLEFQPDGTLAGLLWRRFIRCDSPAVALNRALVPRRHL